MEQGKNRHHFSWCARQWRAERTARLVREHPGMILPMKITLHKELHDDIGPVKPPQLAVARFILGGLLNSENNNDPMTNLSVQALRLRQYANEDLPYSDQAYNLAEHYQNQYDFIQENR